MAVIRERKNHASLWYTRTLMQRIIGTTNPCSPMDSMPLYIIHDSRTFLFIALNLIRGSPYAVFVSML